MIYIPIILIITVIAFIVLIGVEQRDKAMRQKNGLPTKKYHDITDHEVTTVYTIRHH